MMKMLESFEVEFSQEQGENEPLNYFMNPREGGPNQEQLKNWPISAAAFVVKYKNIPSNPGPVAPK
jgi:hypothetical protein